MKSQVLVTGIGRLSPSDIEALREIAELRLLEVANPSSLDLKKALVDCDAYLLGGDERVTREVIETTDHLSAICCLAVGANHFIDIDAATRKGVAVTNTPGMRAMSEALAELTVGHIISIRRKIVAYNNRHKRGECTPAMAPRLADATVGVVGMGKSGQTVARILTLGFGAKVVYAAPRPKPIVERQCGIERVPMDVLLRTSDVVVLLCSLNSETEGLIGEGELAMMKPSAILVNTASAPLVQGPALLEALHAKRIAGASIDDDNWDEPPIFKDGKPINLSRELLRLDDESLLATPYIGSHTRDSWDEMSRSATCSLIELLQTGDTPNIVNPEFRRYSPRDVV
jgi:phosphogluconate 2-dehydrogenase